MSTEQTTTQQPRPRRAQRPPHRNWDRSFLRAGRVFDVLTRPFFRLELELLEPLPPAPILLAANHRSLLDVFLATICLTRLEHPTRFIVGRQFFSRPPLGLFLRRIGCIEGGKGSGADRVAIDAIAAGVSCAIMPEGRVATMEPGTILAPLLPGVATIWTEARCPFVAVGLSGAAQVWRDGHRLPRITRPSRRPIVVARVAAAIPAVAGATDLEVIRAQMEANCRAADVHAARTTSGEPSELAAR
jgi:1-acyl-sn-glycerol-3-phosphate acyltransferase